MADEILAENIRFRGTLGSTLEAWEAFKGNVETAKEAFPDWHNQIDETISCGDRLVMRMNLERDTRGQA